MIETTAFTDIVHANQNQWRHAEREPGTRPISIDAMSHHMSENMRRVFQMYVSPFHPDVQLSIGVLFDRPKEAPIYSYETVIPETIKPEEREFYERGIYLLNEYITNYATKEYVGEVGSNPGKLAMKWFASFMDRSTYGAFCRPVYRVMKQLGKDVHPTILRDALYSAYFTHDNSQFNVLLNNAEIDGVQDVDSLAVLLGKKSQHSKLETRWRNFVENSRVLRSIMVGGATERIGIAQVMPAIPCTLFAASIVTLPLIPIALTVPPAMMYFTAAHEAAHHYSSSEDAFGIVPKVIRKQELPLAA